MHRLLQLHRYHIPHYKDKTDQHSALSCNKKIERIFKIMHRYFSTAEATHRTRTVDDAPNPLKSQRIPRIVI